MTLYFYNTPNHGYLEVDGHTVRKMRIKDRITKYSKYTPERDTWYLEEDVDAPMLLNAIYANHKSVTVHEIAVDDNEFMQ